MWKTKQWHILPVLVHIKLYIYKPYIYIYIMNGWLVMKSGVRFLWHPRLQKLKAFTKARWQNGVCHRDLKPENFLLMKKAPIRGMDVDGDGEIFCGWMVAGYTCTAISWCIYIWLYVYIYIILYNSCVYIIVYIIVVWLYDYIYVYI